MLNKKETESFFISSIDNEYIKKCVDLHKELGAFKRRPLTTIGTDFIKEKMNISIGLAFVIFQFLSYWINGVLIFYISYHFSNNLLKSIVSCIFFYSLFSVIFAFYRPIYSYDEPIQYLFILSSLFFLFNGKKLLFSICLILSIVSRETSLLLIPSLLILNQNKYIPIYNGALKINLIYFLGPIVFYFLYRFQFDYLFLNDYSDNPIVRFKNLSFNFQNKEFIIETIMALVNCTILPTYILIISRKKFLIFKTFFQSYFLALIINTSIVLISSYAREARLFTLPVLLVTPVIGIIIIDMFKKFEPYKTKRFILSCFLMFVFSKFIFLITNEKFYTTTIGMPEENFFNEYSSILLLIIALHFCFVEIYKTKKSIKEKNRFY